MNDIERVTIVEGGKCYDHEQDTDDPAVADILIKGDTIVAVEAGIAARLRKGERHPSLDNSAVDQWIDARGHLVMPGFVSAHYHSHDTLLRGSFEAVPLDYWLMVATPPGYPARSMEELRARTLVGAVECLRGGITAIQDLASVYPCSDEALTTIMDAYAEVGIRCTFALQVVDRHSLDTLPFWRECVPEELHKAVSGASEPEKGVDLPRMLEDLYHAYKDYHPRLSWALGPSSPSRCTPGFLEALADLSRRESLPLFTHLYEKKGMALDARWNLEDYGGSLVKFMQSVGTIGPLVSLAHSIWLLEDEIEELAASRTNVVLCPASNLKTRAGIPPIHEFVAHGVPIALGTDNCSCSDSQNMFNVMKLLVSLAAVCALEPGPPSAKDAIKAATLGGARALGLSDKIGALRPGMKGDLFLVDLTDPSYLPLNSAARQIVYCDSGRAVRTVIVDGQVVVKDGHVTTIDEVALGEVVERVMPELRKDRDRVVAEANKIYPYILEADRRIWRQDVGLNRFVGAPCR